MNSTAEHTFFRFALTWILAFLMTNGVCAAYVPVFGAPAYNSGTGTGYRDGTFGQPAPRNLVNNSGTAVGSAFKITSGNGQGLRAIQWSSSAASAVELSIPARFTSFNHQSWTYAINDAGFSVGAVYNDRLGERPARWDASGAVIELGILGTRGDDFTWGQAYAINNVGITVGYTDRWNVTGTNGNYVDRAARWNSSGAITELGDLSPGSIVTPRSRAFAVNESSTAVGYAQALLQGIADRGTRAVRWDGLGTAATELGNLGLSAGRTQSEAFDVNESGTAVGWALKDGITGFVRPVRWNANSTAATELGTFGGSAPSYAYAINDLGTAVGVAGFRAARWDASGTTAIELGDLGAVDGSRANDINNGDIAVGYSTKVVDGISVGRRAVAWSNDTSPIDLNDLIDPQSGWTLSEAYTISDSGWITGAGLFDADGPGGFATYSRLFLLQLPQVPEPASALLAAVAAAFALARRSRRRSA